MQFVTASGAQIPSLGFGTYGMQGGAVSNIIPAALQAGFRHIDTAQVYANEADVGLGIAMSGMARADVFITTKIWAPNCAPGPARSSVEESLRKLGSDYVDLLLLHWPNDDVPLEEQIGALNDIVRTGKARHIGVSNYNRALLARAIQLSEVPLVTNQFEYHPVSGSACSRVRGSGRGARRHCVLRDGCRPGFRGSDTQGDRRTQRPLDLAGRTSMAGPTGRCRGAVTQYPPGAVG